MTHQDRVSAVAALGFTERQADFLVHVMLHSGVCLGRQYCTFAGIARGNDTFFFDPAVIERKLPAAELPGPAGWAWPELDKVSEAAGVAPRAHRDALKLLAVFVQHSDSKRDNQRIVCLDRTKDEETMGPDGKRDMACEQPLM